MTNSKSKGQRKPRETIILPSVNDGFRSHEEVTYSGSKADLVEAVEKLVPRLTSDIGGKTYPWQLDGYNSHHLFLRLTGLDTPNGGLNFIDEEFDLMLQDQQVVLSIHTHSQFRKKLFNALVALLDSILERVH